MSPVFFGLSPCVLHRTPITTGQGDKILWTGSSVGDFSTKSAWEAIRQASPRRKLLADVWHRSLWPAISVFLWQLFQDRIPVDARMRQKGFNFPSECQCREAEETVSHLFIVSTAVQGMWQHFATLLGSTSLIRGASLIWCTSGGCIRYRNQYASRAHCRLAGFGACPDPRSSRLGGGGGCHDGDFALTVPCF
ncbi:UNVERIFIED_CONTAM: hypothetical protein Sangu_3026000 [Sesamum angustifolium]|uniref:Reverse transcriptase zinc-binding domain-containing protein n=1 Tax=Sesamum angustifolium TaxID=2727405 RepID=A0AAW2KM81_9LAMI